MRRIIYSILTLSLIFTGSLSMTSCSKDDSPEKVVPNPNPEPEPNPIEEKLVITASAASAYLGETITLSATLDGTPVTNGVVYYVNDVAISGNTITSDVAADLLVSAKYQNTVESDYISVSFAVNPFIGIEGQGSFTYNGTTVAIEGALLEAINVFPDANGGYTVWWIQYGWSGNNPNQAQDFVAISFDTPAVVQNNQLVSYEVPGANQNTFYSIETAVIGGQVHVGEQFTDATGTVVYNAFDNESIPVTADFDINVSGIHNINFSYQGAVSAIPSARAKMINGNKLNLQVKSLKDKASVREALIKKILKK